MLKLSLKLSGKWSPLEIYYQENLERYCWKRRWGDDVDVMQVIKGY
jgi:hypothetical protein